MTDPFESYLLPSADWCLRHGRYEEEPACLPVLVFEDKEEGEYERGNRYGERHR